MIPTVEQIVADVQAHVNDVDGEVFTPARIIPEIRFAYEELHDEMLQHNLPWIRKQAHFVLPAYTSLLTPAQAGISDLGEVAGPGLEEAAVPSTPVAITAAAGSPVVVTAAGHGLTDNTEVIVYGVAGLSGANGRWFVTVSGDDLTLRGSVGMGTYTSGGFVVVATSEFRELTAPTTGLPLGTIDSTLKYFEWRGDAWVFRGATADRLLRITYEASASEMPTTGSVGIDNSRQFLAVRAAAELSFKSDRPSEGQRLLGVAGKRLHELLNPMVKTKQRQSWQPRAFRGTVQDVSRGRGGAPYIIVESP